VGNQSRTTQASFCNSSFAAGDDVGCNLERCDYHVRPGEVVWIMATVPMHEQQVKIRIAARPRTCTTSEKPDLDGIEGVNKRLNNTPQGISFRSEMPFVNVTHAPSLPVSNVRDVPLFLMSRRIRQLGRSMPAKVPGGENDRIHGSVSHRFRISS
jgi:hypothetical protein